MSAGLGFRFVAFCPAGKGQFGKDSLVFCFIGQRVQGFSTTACFCDSAVSYLEKDNHIEANNSKSSGFFTLDISFIGF